MVTQKICSRPFTGHGFFYFISADAKAIFSDIVVIGTNPIWKVSFCAMEMKLGIFDLYHSQVVSISF